MLCRHILLKFECRVGWHPIPQECLLFILGPLDFHLSIFIMAKELLVCFHIRLLAMVFSSKFCLGSVQELLRTSLCPTIFRGKDNLDNDWEREEEEMLISCSNRSIFPFSLISDAFQYLLNGKDFHNTIPVAWAEFCLRDGYRLSLLPFVAWILTCPLTISLWMWNLGWQPQWWSEF